MTSVSKTLMHPQVVANGLFAFTLVFGAGLAFWIWYQSKAAIQKAVEQPISLYWDWYYDVNKRPAWVHPFNWGMLKRQDFNNNWQMDINAYTVFKMTYADELSSILDANRVLREEFREMVN